jgi:hypothetical protein
MARPSAREYPPYFSKYIDLVPETEIVSALEKQREELLGFLERVPESEAGVRHRPYTWTTREVVGHMIDTERIMGYRALRFARNDSKPLSGFEQNPYVESAQFDRLPLHDLAAEFEALRRSHIYLFQGLTAEAWERTGVASDNPISVRALAFILVGHARHHLDILRKRHRGEDLKRKG